MTSYWYNIVFTTLQGHKKKTFSGMLFSYKKSLLSEYCAQIIASIMCRSEYCTVSHLLRLLMLWNYRHKQQRWWTSVAKIGSAVFTEKQEQN